MHEAETEALQTRRAGRGGCGDRHRRSRKAIRPRARCRSPAGPGCTSWPCTECSADASRPPKDSDELATGDGADAVGDRPSSHSRTTARRAEVAGRTRRTLGRDDAERHLSDRSKRVLVERRRSARLAEIADRARRSVMPAACAERVLASVARYGSSMPLGGRTVARDADRRTTGTSRGGDPLDRVLARRASSIRRGRARHPTTARPDGVSTSRA